MVLAADVSALCLSGSSCGWLLVVGGAFEKRSVKPPFFGLPMRDHVHGSAASATWWAPHLVTTSVCGL